MKRDGCKRVLQITAHEPYLQMRIPEAGSVLLKGRICGSQQNSDNTPSIINTIVTLK